MNWDKLVYHGAVSVNIILSVMVIYRSLKYCAYHPNGLRRTGAWILVFACLGYDLNNARFLLNNDITYGAYGIDMLSLIVNQGVLFIAAILLMRKNDRRVVDADDVRVILEHFDKAECEFAGKYRKAREEKQNDL